MINSVYSNMNDSIIRHITSKVELYNGSTLLGTYTKTGNLQSVEISRQGAKGKFFGFGVCQQATVVLLDKDRRLNIEKGQKLKTYFSASEEEDYLKIGPSFTVSSVERDETNNTLKIVAYDLINDATSHSVGELGLIPPYTVKHVVERITSLLGLSVNITDEAFNLSYAEGANFGGDETLRAVLDAAAEVTQTIYYINHNDELTFKTLDKSGEAVHLIEKSAYFELQIKDSITLSNICQATELGNNVIAGDDSGVTQYVRENPFWNNLTEVSPLLTTALNRIGGLTITQFNIKWRGNFLLEIGDKIGIKTKDNSTVNTFVLDDVIKYSGGLSETTDWEYTPENDRATVNNPITIGEKLTQTFAKVDKVNKEITLVASEVSETKSAVAELKLTTDDIILRVEKVENQEFDLDISNDENFINLSERVGALEVSDTEIIASVSETKTTLQGYTDAAISDMRNQLNSETASMRSTVTAVTQAMSALQIKADEIEASVNTLETTFNDSLEDAISKLDEDLKKVITDGDNAINAEVTTIKENIAALEIETGKITASVSDLETTVISQINDAVSDLESSITEVETELNNNIDEAAENLNGEITIVKQNISTLQVESSGINASVKSLESTTTDSLNSLNSTVSALSKEVNLKVDSETVTILVEKSLEEGVDKVKTSSKQYTFDDAGLDISSSDSEISTLITEDGMRIYKNTTEVLTANNQGVVATDLHARTFLIIGENSRLEDRGRRTACFWIGPAEE